MKMKIISTAMGILAASVCLTPASRAALTWVGNGFAILNVNSGGNIYYDLDNPTGNPDFDNDNSSANAYSTTFTINLGQSIKLGGQNQTFDQGGGTSSFLGYRVSTDFTGGFIELNLPYNISPGSNDQWEEAGGGMAEIGSSLALGTYYLSLYQHASRGGDNVYHDEAETSGNQWEARIVVIPEPSAALLGGLGLLGLLRRRR